MQRGASFKPVLCQHGFEGRQELALQKVPDTRQEKSCDKERASSD